MPISRGRDTGFILVALLVFMSLMAASAAAAVGMMTAEAQHMAYERNGMQAFYLAEAGAERSLHMLRGNPAWRTGFTSVSLGAGAYSATVADIPGGLVRITATGDVRGDVRSLEVTATTAGVGRQFKRIPYP